MKKSIIITLALVAVSLIGFSQSMNFVTLGVNLNAVPTSNDGGKTYISQWTAFYGVQGCPYDKQRTNDWTGFVAYATLTVKSSTTSADPFTQIALDSADAYRKRVYPNKK